MGTALQRASADPAETVACVAAARRQLLLRAYSRRLRFEDLEDCYSQATLELVVRARRSPFANADHVKNALEQKFVSRINDRRRALAGRSGIEAALANAISVDGSDAAIYEIEDRSAGVERHVELHADIRRLREVIGDLSLDQRLVLYSQVNLQMDANVFCEHYGWSKEKFRKVAQRARAKLRLLVTEYQTGERCNRLLPDLLASVEGKASNEQLRRARIHTENCPACAHSVGALERAARTATVVLPLPVVAAGASRANLAWLGAAARRLMMRHPAGQASAPVAAGVSGGSTAGLVLAKAGVVALCLAGTAGGYAICQHAGIALSIGAGLRPAREHVAERARDAERLRELSIPAASLRHRVPSPRPLSALVQIKREFGAHPAAASAVSSTFSAIQARPVGGALPAQSAATVRQEASEFGFER